MQSFLQNEVKALSKFNIDIYGLEERPYEFDYALGEAFFEQMPQEIIERGDFKVHLRLEKSSTMIQLWFTIDGQAELTCDRSLEPFEEPVHTKDKLILKFGDHYEELTDEISIINRNTGRINVANYIFEFIALAMPMRKIHPDLREEDDEATDDDQAGAIIYSSEKNEVETKNEEPKTDPRWEALKKLK